MYVEFRDRPQPALPGNTNFTAWFDMATDPWQMDNAARYLSVAERRHWQADLWSVATCAGQACP